MESGDHLLRLVDTLCASGRAAEAHHRVALLLLSGAASPSLSRSRFDALLRRLLRARTPLLTLRLLQHAAPALVPTRPNYNRLLALLCRTDQLFPVLLAHRLLLRMRAPPDAVSYAALLDGYARVSDPRAARKLLDEMPGCRLVPTSLARTFLVKALLRDREVDAAMDLVDNHLWQRTADNDDCNFQEDQEVTNAAFANLVQCFCAEGFFHIIFQIAEEMPQRRRHVDDEFAYAQMIDSLCRTGQHHGASRIVYIMRKRGLCPSSVSYNCIVHGLCTSQKPGGRLRAHQLVMEGVSFSYRPREETYKVLVDQLCRENELSKAKDVLELMLQPQSHHDKSGNGVDEETRTRIYNIFLGALRVMDNPSEQLAVLMSMLQAGCKPDVITMNTVIHGFSKAGRSHEARRILDDMLSGKFCAPDVVTFTTLISGYLEAGDHAEALDVLHTLMPRRRCSPTVVTYNCVLKGLFGLQQVDTAMQIFEEMKANNVAADSVTYTLVIKVLCDAGRLEKAKAFWDDVVWPSGIHDDYVYSAIFRGLCKQGKLEQACDFLYELVDSGISPGLVCYNILIDTACKEGSKKLAYQLVKEMRRNGLTPDAVTWRIIGKLHHCEKEEPEQRHHLPNSDVAQSSADDRVEPFISKESETPLLSSSKHLHETNENRNKVKMKGDVCAEGEFGCSTEMTEESLDKYEPAKEQEDHMMDNSRYGIADGVTQEDSLTKPCKQSIIREPLSEVARKVFGLL
ncbi:hypothetical protein QOZ80_7BG0612650 [Eleusine coracana subsp. coracana]|nr:hypothetical protein QOZ80_7BG0612650 [Eleusine coracana subsp. coracana]